MVIEVDDSGWGDLLGGVVIVLRRLETDEKYVGEVPIQAFQGGAFKEKIYLKEAIQIVKDGINALSIPRNEIIHICTGYILSDVRKNLTDDGYNLHPSRIIGTTQALAEGEYINHLICLGIGTPDQVRQIRGFNTSLAWVLRDLKKRERFVKTGWNAWPRLKRGEKSEPH